MEKHIKELMNEFEQMLRENPDKVVEYTEHLYKHNPDAVRKMLMTYEDNGGSYLVSISSAPFFFQTISHLDGSL